MSAGADIDALLARLDALEAACNGEHWELAEQQMGELDAAIRATDWSLHGSDALRRLQARQQALALRFIHLREEAATLLKQISRSQKARASYGGGTP